MRPIALVVLLLVTAVTPAQACLRVIHRSYDDVRQATSVFRGQLINYVGPVGRRPAIITFKVVETLRGKAREQVVASWASFQAPAKWKESNALIVAATEKVNEAIGSEIQILYETCSQPLMFEDSKENLEAIKRAIAAP